MSDAYRGAEDATFMACYGWARHALDIAVQSPLSPCSKSKSSAVIWRSTNGEIVGQGCNHQPHPYRCDGTELCKKNCSKRCVHAGQDAILNLREKYYDMHMVHVKVVDGAPAAGGPPSCMECSKLILSSGIQVMWLYEVVEDGPNLIAYPSQLFHELSMRNTGIL